MLIEAIVKNKVNKKKHKYVIAFNDVKLNELNENLEYWASENNFQVCSWKEVENN